MIKKEIIEKFKILYPKKGKMWSMKHFKLTESQARCLAFRLSLKQDKTSLFFKKWQLKARQSKIGKKRPLQSLIMKKLWEEGKIQSTPREERLKSHKNLWSNNKHPRGMLGKTHNKINKEKMSIKSKLMWKNKDSYVNSVEYRQKLSDRMSLYQQKGVMRNRYSKGKMGHYDINGKNIFFRSSWEPNYALYLDFLIKQKQIISWEYEKDTFWFEKIKRGVRSYKPDFKILNNDNSVEYHEIKGWMDNKSKTKLKRMKKYYPKIKIILVEKDSYNDIKNKLGKLLNFY